MLAAKMYAPHDIRLEETPVPEIGAGELLLRVRAAAVCGTDIRMYQNGYAGIAPDTPRVLGHEFSGVIAAVGSGVTAYREGQRIAIAPNMGCGVCAACVRGDGHLCRTYRALGINMDGGFAEYCRIPAAAVSGGNVALLEDTVSFEEAAINEALSCVCNGFERCDVRPGDDVLIIGAGPIGLMHAMLAQMGGAGRVYIHDLSEQRLAMCKTIDPRFRTIAGDVKDVIMRETNGEGVNVCVTACPSPAAQATALELCAVNARINFFGGIPADRQPVGINTNLIHYKQLYVCGTTRASITQYRKTLKFIATGILNVKPLITHRYALADIQQAFDHAAAADGLKSVIVMQ